MFCYGYLAAKAGIHIIDVSRGTEPDSAAGVLGKAAPACPC
jgi:hypothetical protein